jgi:hypothetical protein
MTEILFVCGYNTHPDDHPNNLDVYDAFNQYFQFSKYKITFFRYKMEERLDSVYKRMCDEISLPKYSILISHSLGGGLMTKYLSEHNEDRKVILLMPFIKVPKWKHTTFVALNMMPLSLRLPKWFVVPNNSLFKGGNFWNDDSTMLNLAQIIYAINYLFLDDATIVHTIEQTKDIILVYAEDETVSQIDMDLLNKINKKTFVQGKHVSFLDPYTTRAFFDLFLQLL